MKVGWLVDEPGYLGGAELTAAEFKAAAPEGVEVVDCPVGEVAPGLDTYVVHNVVRYSMTDLAPIRGKRITKYIHDVWPRAQPGVREYLLANAKLVFCSPLHRRRFPYEIPDWTATYTIPPPLDLDRFKPPRQSRRHRKGTCSIAQWRNPGKGGWQLMEYAKKNGGVDLYGGGEYLPGGEHLNFKGVLPPEDVSQTLWKYERFVFLPFDLEPFCRTVAEAHAAGCEVVTNDLVGARHYIENDPDALTTAAEDFWRVVLT